MVHKPPPVHGLPARTEAAHVRAATASPIHTVLQRQPSTGARLAAHVQAALARAGQGIPSKAPPPPVQGSRHFPVAAQPVSAHLMPRVAPHVQMALGAVQARLQPAGNLPRVGVIQRVIDIQLSSGSIQIMSQKETQDTGTESVDVLGLGEPILKHWLEKNRQQREAQQLAGFAKKIHARLQANGSVTVNCKLGQHRSPTVVIFYLVKFQGMSWEKARQIVEEAAKKSHHSIRDDQIATSIENVKKMMSTLDSYLSDGGSNNNNNAVTNFDVNNNNNSGNQHSAWMKIRDAEVRDVQERDKRWGYHEKGGQ